MEYLSINQVSSWTIKQCKKWLRTQLKPDYKRKHIKFRLDSSGQEIFSIDGWMLAYRSGMWIWLWRGHPASIHAVTEEERNATEEGSITRNDGTVIKFRQSKRWQEYYCFPP